jgi:hypothetical protein
MIGSRWLRALLAAVMAAVWVVTLQAATATPAAADELPGCNGRWQMRGDPWRETTVFLHDDSWWTPEVTWVIVVHHGTLGYWFCPNGDKPAKVRPNWIDWCWAMTDQERHRMFQGTSENAWIWDAGGRNYNPPTVRIGDDGTRQNCVTQDVAGRYDPWMPMADEPRWRAWWAIHIAETPDKDGPYLTAAGSKTNYIRPLDSTPIGEWVYP